jgi:hypothetical protein
VKVLLEYGADPTAGDTEYGGPLNALLDSFLDILPENPVATVQLLLANGAVTTTADGEGSILHKAVDTGNIELLDLLSKTDGTIEAENSRGETPLLRAIRLLPGNNYDLGTGAYLRATHLLPGDNIGLKLFQIFAGMLRTLLSWGANPNHRNEHFGTALYEFNRIWEAKQQRRAVSESQNVQSFSDFWLSNTFPKSGPEQMEALKLDIQELLTKYNAIDLPPLPASERTASDGAQHHALVHDCD